MTLKDIVKFPPARDFAIAKLEIKGMLRRFLNMATSFVHKTRADCEKHMRFQVPFMQSANDTRNKLGKVVNEQIRLVAFDLIAELEDAKEDGNLDPKFITEVIFGRRRTKFERHSRVSALPSFPHGKRREKTDLMLPHFGHMAWELPAPPWKKCLSLTRTKMFLYTKSALTPALRFGAFGCAFAPFKAGTRRHRRGGIRR